MILVPLACWRQASMSTAPRQNFIAALAYSRIHISWQDAYFPRISECTLRFLSQGISDTHSPCTCRLAKLRTGFALAVCSYTLVLRRINSMSANRLRFCLFRASPCIPNSCMALHSCEHLGLYQCTYINIFLEMFLDISYRDHVLIRYALNTFHNGRRVRARCVTTMGMIS